MNCREPSHHPGRWSHLSPAPPQHLLHRGPCSARYFVFVAEGEGAEHVFALLMSAIATSLSILWVNNNNLRSVVIVAKPSAMVVIVSFSHVLLCREPLQRLQRTTMRSFSVRGLSRPFDADVFVERSVASSKVGGKIASELSAAPAG